MAKTNKKYSRKRNSKRNTKRNSRRNTLRKYSHKKNNRSSRKTTLRKYSRNKNRSSRKTTLRKYSHKKNNRSSRKITLRKTTLRKYSRNKNNRSSRKTTLRKYSRNKRNTLRKYSRNKRNTLRKYSRNKIMRGGSLMDEEFQKMVGSGVVLELKPNCSPPYQQESITVDSAKYFKSSHSTIDLFLSNYYKNSSNTFREVFIPPQNLPPDDDVSGNIKMGYLRDSDDQTQWPDYTGFSQKFSKLTDKLNDIFPNYIEFVKNDFGSTWLQDKQGGKFGILKLGVSNKNGMVCLAKTFMDETKRLRGQGISDHQKNAKFAQYRLLLSKKYAEGSDDLAEENKEEGVKMSPVEFIQRDMNNEGIPFDQEDDLEKLRELFMVHYMENHKDYDNLEALHVDDDRAVLLPEEEILSETPPWSGLEKLEEGEVVIDIEIKDSFKDGGKLLCDPGIEITSGTPDLEIQKKALLYLFKPSIPESDEIYFYCGYVKIAKCGVAGNLILNSSNQQESYGWIKAVFINVYKQGMEDKLINYTNRAKNLEILFLPLFGTRNKKSGLSEKLPGEFSEFRIFKSVDKKFQTVDWSRGRTGRKTQAGSGDYVKVNEIRLTKNYYKSLNPKTLESLINASIAAAAKKETEATTPEGKKAAKEEAITDKERLRKFLLDPEELNRLISKDRSIDEVNTEAAEREFESQQRKAEEKRREEVKQEEMQKKLSKLLSDSGEGYKSRKIDDAREELEREDLNTALRIMKLEFTEIMTNIQSMKDLFDATKEGGVDFNYPKLDDLAPSLKESLEQDVINRFMDDRIYIKYPEDNREFIESIKNDGIMDEMKKITFSVQSVDLHTFLQSETDKKIKRIDDMGSNNYAKYYYYRDIEKNGERIKRGFSSLGHDDSFTVQGGDDITKWFEGSKGDTVNLMQDLFEVEMNSRKPKYEQQKRTTDIELLKKKEAKKLEKKREEQKQKEEKIELEKQTGDLETLNGEIQSILNSGDLTTEVAESISGNLDEFVEKMAVQSFNEDGFPVEGNLLSPEVLKIIEEFKNDPTKDKLVDIKRLLESRFAKIQGRQRYIEESRQSSETGALSLRTMPEKYASEAAEAAADAALAKAHEEAQAAAAAKAAEIQEEIGKTGEGGETDLSTQYAHLVAGDDY